MANPFGLAAILAVGLVAAAAPAQAATPITSPIVAPAAIDIPTHPGLQPWVLENGAHNGIARR